MKNSHVLLASNCLITKGASKNLLLDIQNNNWYHIDFDIPDRDNIEIENFTQEEREYMLDNQILINVPSVVKNNFPRIELEYDIPSDIEIAILDRNSNSEYNIFEAIYWLDSLFAKLYQFRYFSPPKIREIEDVLVFTEKRLVESIDIVIPYSISLVDYFKGAVKRYPKLSSVTFHSTVDLPLNNDKKSNFLFTKQKITSDSCCGIVHPAFFSPNKKHILKSINYNSCLYKKVGIDVKGNIKNCPSMKETIGHVEGIEKINLNDLETEYWHITKDDVDICQDCEFRYICTDCRVKVQKGKYSRPLTCTYNPYTNLWKGQKGYEEPLIIL